MYPFFCLNEKKVWCKNMHFFQWFQGKRRKLFVVMSLGLVCFAWGSLMQLIPDQIRVSDPDHVTVGEHLPVSCDWKAEQEVFAGQGEQTLQMTCRFLGIIPVKKVTVQVVDEKEVVAVGDSVGILLNTSGVYVASVAQIKDLYGRKQEPAAHIVKEGDYIRAVNGEPVKTKEELLHAVSESQGKELVLTLLRAGETLNCKVQPVQTGKDEYRIGLWIKDDLAGVGTITYIDRAGNFGALGHGISSSETKELLSLDRGKLYQSRIAAINKGQKGTPGELVGMIYYTDDNYYGEILANTQEGIFGKLTKISEEAAGMKPIAIGYKQEIQAGPAEIYCNVDGEIRSYDIEIEEVKMNSRNKNKSMLIRVTDPVLLQKTGGIVQGMSGSPIIQNGKIVGAVTHVLVNDPTRGYGIFIENMLDAAEEMKQQG